MKQMKSMKKKKKKSMKLILDVEAKIENGASKSMTVVVGKDQQF